MNANINIAVNGYRKVEPDPPEIQAAKAEYMRLSDAHRELSQKVMIQKKILASIEMRHRPGTPADIERLKNEIAELDPKMAELEYAFNSCSISRYIKGEITREQIISGNIPPYTPPASREVFGDYPEEWIKANSKKWERGAKIRYYFRNAHAILEKVGIPYGYDEEGNITHVNGSTPPDLSGIYFDAIECRFGAKNKDCNWIVERLTQAFKETGACPKP